jgi:hypothetical protein
MSCAPHIWSLLDGAGPEPTGTATAHAVSGSTQHKPGKREKSLSHEYSVAPCSITNAARVGVARQVAGRAQWGEQIAQHRHVPGNLG